MNLLYKTQCNLFFGGGGLHLYSTCMPTHSDKPRALTLFHLYVPNLALSYLMEHLL